VKISKKTLKNIIAEELQEMALGFEPEGAMGLPPEGGGELELTPGDLEDLDFMASDLLVDIYGTVEPEMHQELVDEVKALHRQYIEQGAVNGKWDAGDIGNAVQVALDYIEHQKPEPRMEGKTKMKITKKTLKNIIAEELKALLSEMLSPAQEYAYSRGQLKVPQSPKYEPPMETKYDRMSQDERRLRAEYDNLYPSAAEICRRVQYDPGSVTTIEDTECTNYNERKDAHVSAELAKKGIKMATEGKTKISRSTLKRIIAKELQSGRLE